MPRPCSWSLSHSPVHVSGPCTNRPCPDRTRLPPTYRRKDSSLSLRADDRHRHRRNQSSTHRRARRSRGALSKSAKPTVSCFRTRKSQEVSPPPQHAQCGAPRRSCPRISSLHTNCDCDWRCPTLLSLSTGSRHVKLHINTLIRCPTNARNSFFRCKQRWRFRTDRRVSQALRFRRRFRRGAVLTKRVCASPPPNGRQMRASRSDRRYVIQPPFSQRTNHPSCSALAFTVHEGERALRRRRDRGFLQRLSLLLGHTRKEEKQRHQTRAVFSLFFISLYSQFLYLLGEFPCDDVDAKP